jgi:hypothetical protein
MNFCRMDRYSSYSHQVISWLITSTHFMYHEHIRLCNITSCIDEFSTVLITSHVLHCKVEHRNHLSRQSSIATEMTTRVHWWYSNTVHQMPSESNISPLLGSSSMHHVWSIREIHVLACFFYWKSFRMLRMSNACDLRKSRKWHDTMSDRTRHFSHIDVVVLKCWVICEWVKINRFDWKAS